MQRSALRTAVPLYRLSTAQQAPAFHALVGDLLDYQPARAVLVKHLPGAVEDGQIEMVRGLTFRALQQFSPDTVTNVLLAKIDADLAELPPRPALKSAAR